MQITSGDMPMLSDLQLVYMVPRNSTELLKINTTKFQVEREPVYRIYMILNYTKFVVQDPTLLITFKSCGSICITFL